MAAVHYFYLFSALTGALLVAVSVFSGSDGAAGHADTNAGLGDVHGDGEGDGNWLGGLGSAAMLFFSLQFWTYLLGFGGLTGLLLHFLAHTPEPTTGCCALLVGLGTALAARKILRRLSTTGDGGTVEQEKLIGASAEVLIPAAQGATGKIRLMARGQTLDLLARTTESAGLQEGTTVLILNIKDGVAEVTLEDLAEPKSQKPQATAGKRASAEASSAPKG